MEGHEMQYLCFLMQKLHLLDSQIKQNILKTAEIVAGF
jgi:hypothetical protein